jgi:hypothetical protein
MSYLNNRINTTWKNLKASAKLKKQYRKGYWEQKYKDRCFFLLGFLYALKEIREHRS